MGKRKDQDRDNYDGFNDWEDVMFQFRVNEKKPTRVFAAFYDTGDGSGDACVMYQRGRKYYVANGGHCSCYGLEGQWEPIEYATKALFVACLKRIVDCGWGVQERAASTTLKALGVFE